MIRYHMTDGDKRVPLAFLRTAAGGEPELRVSLESKREARVLFVVKDEQLIALHGFVKKSEKTPKTDLDLARQRQRELEKKT